MTSVCRRWTPRLREELRVELRRIQRRLGATFVYVTHDQVEATTLAESRRHARAGRLLQVGAPQRVYTDPDSLRVAQRLGSPADQHRSFGLVRLALAAPRALVGMRPENVLFNDPAGVRCRVLEHSARQTSAGREREGRRVARDRHARSPARGRDRDFTGFRRRSACTSTAKASAAPDGWRA